MSSGTYVETAPSTLTEDQASFISQTLTEQPVEPGKRRPGSSRETDAVIMRALAKNPAERWPTVTEFARALRTSVGVNPWFSAATWWERMHRPPLKPAWRPVTAG